MGNQKDIATLNGATWMDRELKVNQARERENKGSFNRSNRRDNRF